MDKPSILNPFKTAEASADQVVQLDLSQLKANPFQPRKRFDPMELEELSRSIREFGVIQPILARKVGDGYEIVAGERRCRASRLAGLTRIPAVLRQLSDKEMAQIALIENLQRSDLNYFEEAEGYQRLMDEFGLTQEEVAVRVGKSQSAVANKLRLLKISGQVKEKVMVELVTERHIRSLLKLKEPEDQMKILQAIYENDLNVRETEGLIADFLAGRFVVGDGKNPREEFSQEITPKRSKTHRLSGDMRIYYNTIKAAVETIRQAGLPAVISQEENEDHLLVTIRLPKVTKAGTKAVRRRTKTLRPTE